MSMINTNNIDSNGKVIEQHYFISCYHSWRTTKSLTEAMKIALHWREDAPSTIDKLIVYLVSVPLPLNTNYCIENYLPVVEGIKTVQLYLD